MVKKLINDEFYFRKFFIWAIGILLPLLLSLTGFVVYRVIVDSTLIDSQQQIIIKTQDNLNVLFSGYSDIKAEQNGINKSLEATEKRIDDQNEIIKEIKRKVYRGTSANFNIRDNKVVSMGM